MADQSSLSSLSDEDLLARFPGASGHAAFSELVMRHADKFRALAYRFTNSVSDAEDIVQDAFITLWTKPQSWKADKKTKFTTWFYRIIVNRCLDWKRRKKPSAMPENDDSFRDDAALQDEVLIEKQRLDAVERAFRTLPQDMQTALNLSFYEPVPNTEAAQVMGLSLKAFQSLLMRAKTSLRDKVTRLQQMPERKAYGT